MPCCDTDEQVIGVPSNDGGMIGNENRMRLRMGVIVPLSW